MSEEPAYFLYCVWKEPRAFEEFKLKSPLKILLEEHYCFLTFWQGSIINYKGEW